MVEILNNENFKEKVLDRKGLTLVDFWASWCGPCKMLGPVVEELSNEYEGKVYFGKVNVDDEPYLADQYRINSIPCLILFEDGKVKDTLIGYRPKEQIENFLK